MSDGSAVATLLRLALSLAAVLVLMVLLARYLRRRQIGGGSGLGPGRRRSTAAVEVVSRHGLSRGSSVAVVRVCGELLLLGVTESSVAVLRELRESPLEAPQDGTGSSPQGRPLPGTSFGNTTTPEARFENSTGPGASFEDRLQSVSTGAFPTRVDRLAVVRRPQVAGPAGTVVEVLRQWTSRRG